MGRIKNYIIGLTILLVIVFTAILVIMFHINTWWQIVAAIIIATIISYKTFLFFTIFISLLFPKLFQEK